ncbi:MAG: hypothetical protein ACRC0X_02240 [Brevinema sp.]
MTKEELEAQIQYWKSKHNTFNAGVFEELKNNDRELRHDKEPDEII